MADTKPDTRPPAQDDRRTVHFSPVPKHGGKHNSLGSRPPGRPSIYRPEYCETVEDLGRQGMSPAQIASELNVTKSTLYVWAGVYPEFQDSLARAKTHEQAAWERIGIKALPRKHFQAQVWRTSMAARFKDEYTEGRQIDVTLSLGDIVKRSLQAPEPIEVAASVAAPDKG